MGEVEVTNHLDRLFASTSAADIRAAFVLIPDSLLPDILEHLTTEARTADDEVSRRVADTKLAVWRLTTAGNFAEAWTFLESSARNLIDEVLVPRSKTLLAETEEHISDENWTALLEAGRELLTLVEAGGPPELRVQARRAIAIGSFHDAAETRFASLETALSCWEQILAIIHDHPDSDWGYIRAVALTNLGTVLGARMRGDPRANQERAIACQREALTLFTMESDGDGWAMAHTNLGLSLLEHAVELRVGEIDSRVLGMPDEEMSSDIRQASDDVEEAIGHFRSALEWRSVSRDAADWGYTQTNLGLAFGRRREGDPRTNVETSVSHYTEAARAFAAAGREDLRAVALHDIASETLRLAHLEDTPDEERKQLLVNALSAAREAAEYERVEVAPVQVGRAWSLVGDVLVASGRQLEAMAAYQKALRGLSASTTPRLCLRAAQGLASLAADDGDWVRSADAWELAAEAASAAVLVRATSRGRFDEIDISQNIHRWAAYAAARAGRPRTAVELLETGRSRELARWIGADVEAIEELRSRDEALAERYTILEQAMQSIERDIQAGLPVSEETAAQTSEWLGATIRDIRELDGFRDFLQPPSFSEVAASVRPAEAVVYLLTAPSGSLALIVYAGGELCVVDARTLTSVDAFQVFLVVDVEEETISGYFVGHHVGGEELEASISTAESLIAEPLLQPISQALRDAGVSEACLVPVSLLGLLPLHALSWVEGDEKRCLLDDFVVTTAPSAFLRSVCRRRSEERGGSSRRVLIVVNPESDEDPLINADLEAAAITSAFRSDEITLLAGADATKSNVVAALQTSDFAHFACHGLGAVLGAPLETGLLLAPDDLWLAAEILHERPLATRLVVASACETGVIQGGTSATDEVISLSSVFLAAGAAGCVATLWAINDYTTALLMTRFYEEFGEGAGAAQALRNAQLWLRDLTDEDEEEYVGAREVLGQHKARGGHSGDVTAARREGPYASPVYWAPFVYSGA